MTTHEFQYYLSEFLARFLPGEVGAATNTIMSFHLALQVLQGPRGHYPRAHDVRTVEQRPRGTIPGLAGGRAGLRPNDPQPATGRDPIVLPLPASPGRRADRAVPACLGDTKEEDQNRLTSPPLARRDPADPRPARYQQNLWPTRPRATGVDRRHRRQGPGDRRPDPQRPADRSSRNSQTHRQRREDQDRAANATDSRSRPAFRRRRWSHRARQQVPAPVPQPRRKENDP
jgi:hypothetical protein